MNLDQQIEKIASFKHLEVLANQIVEEFISGMHKSPFHGFSAEFAEHKVYNPGESTKHLDWKLFAKTDRLYTKRYEEETNLRCHLIIDNSSSMHYPKLKNSQSFFENKIGFSVLASAVLMNLLKKQRDAVGLSIFSDSYEYYAPEKAEPGFMARKDFVGWTGLPPISVLIEYLFGIRANVQDGKMVIDVHLADGYGISRYPFGKDGLVSIKVKRRTSAEEKPCVTIETNVPFELTLMWGDHKMVSNVKVGKQTI